MSYPSPPLFQPPSSSPGKGMLPGVLAGAAIILIATILLVLGGFAVATVVNLDRHIEYARTSNLPTDKYEEALGQAGLLAAFCALTGLLSFLMGAGVLLASVIIGRSNRVKIAEGYSPPMLLRVVLPGAVLALALLFLLVVGAWRLFSPEVSTRRRDAQIAQDIDEKRRDMEDAARKWDQVGLDSIHAAMARQRDQVMVLIRALNGDGDEATRQAAFNKLAGAAPTAHGFEATATPAGWPTYESSSMGNPPRGSMLSAEDKAELIKSLKRYDAIFSDPLNSTLIDRFSIYFLRAEWQDARRAILNGP